MLKAHERAPDLTEFTPEYSRIQHTMANDVMEMITFQSGDFYLDIDAFLGLFKRSNSENEYLMELV